MTLVTYISRSLCTIIRPDEHWGVWDIFRNRDCGDGLADTVEQQISLNAGMCSKGPTEIGGITIGPFVE
jgi:hypothetical protein